MGAPGGAQAQPVARRTTVPAPLHRHLKCDQEWEGKGRLRCGTGAMSLIEEGRAGEGGTGRMSGSGRRPSSTGWLHAFADKKQSIAYPKVLLV